MDLGLGIVVDELRELLDGFCWVPGVGPHRSRVVPEKIRDRNRDIRWRRQVSDAVDQSSPAAEVATGRDWQRSVTFFVVLGILVVPFLLLLLLVTDKWGPLAAADQGARDGLHVFALGSSWFVGAMRTFSDSGSSLAWQIVTVVVALVLLVRRRWRLAAFVVVTIAGSSLLNSAVKATVNRDRPAVDQPFVHEPGASFPSGHSQAAMVGYGVLLLLLLPALSRGWRRAAVVLAVLMVVGIGFSRVALAAHFVSDVLAGFALGAVWLGLMTAIFRPWRHIDEVERPSRRRHPPHERPGRAPPNASGLDHRNEEAAPLGRDSAAFRIDTKALLLGG